MNIARFRHLACILPGLFASSAGAAIVFQADFNDSTTGLVSLGGTGTLRTSSHYTATVESLNPLLSGGYLRVTNPKTATSGTGNAVTLTPTTAANSWASLHTGGSLSTLNGGADFFVRLVSINETRTNSWFRPIDFGSTANGGLRLIMESQGDDQLRLQIHSASNGLIRENNTTTGTLTAAGTFDFNAGDIAHIGFTFSTDANGWITMSLFAAKTNGGIDTTSATHRLASVTFKIDETIASSGLASGQFFLSGGYLAGTENTVDFDSFRLYDSAPPSFSGIPEPGAASMIIGGAAALVALSVRRQR